MSTFVPLFTQHSRSWRENRYVYPVVSRRSKGLSIGVNLNPDKVCNFDCIYCSVDRTQMPARTAVDQRVLREELRHLLALARTGEIWRHPPFNTAPPHLRRLNDVAFSGDGEPTSYAHFREACVLAAEEIAAAGLPETKIVVITNATLLRRPAVAEALALLDRHNGEIWAKLDAGTEDYYREVERTAVPFDRVLANLLAAARVRPIVIQSLFMRINGQPPGDAEIAAYVGRLRDLLNAGGQIKLVQVYTVARTTAEAYVSHLPQRAMDAIGERVREAGVPVEVYYGPH